MDLRGHCWHLGALSGGLVSPRGAQASASGGSGSPFPAPDATWRLRFLDSADLPTPVISAVGTHLMGRFPLVALCTYAERDRVETLVCTPLCGARLGVPSFGIGHDYVLSCP